ncbi:MAG: ABC transporter permease [Salinarimonas sp.]
MTTFEAILFTIVAASTPLLIAAIGELVAERAGVLNLGVEGMMAMGAVCAFAAAFTFDSTLVGILLGMAAGGLMAALFALAVLGFAANQVGSGLALTIFGLGLSGLIGAPFVGQTRPRVEEWPIPVLSDLPFVGHALFSQDPLVYVTLGLVLGVAWFLSRTRTGLRLRAVGENHVSAHALGLPVLKMRVYAVIFGGLCAGLAGAYLSLVYTRFWSPNMTAGRGWIAVALVVFAAWRPTWALVGALVFGAATVLQLHAQAAQVPLPSQLLAAAPYLATILALVLLSIRRGRAIGAPGSLGAPFVPDR